MRGYFGLVLYRPKTETNIGTLLRSAHNFGAAFVATIQLRYRQQASDTTKATRHVPMLHFDTFGEFVSAAPVAARLIAVEMCDGARSLPGYTHAEQAVYVLGPEDGSLPDDVLKLCHSRVVIPSARCLNLATAGSIVLYDRIAKQERAA